jgi:hypothetical protein
MAISMIVVRRRDVESVAELLQAAMRRAEYEGLSPFAIAEALVEELDKLATRMGDPGAAAGYLRALADELDHSHSLPGRTEG